jgi:hypothetical protein
MLLKPGQESGFTLTDNPYKLNWLARELIDLRVP